MLKLSIEKPTKTTDTGRGWARYRIDFEDLTGDFYVLGWVIPWTTKTGHEIEVREFLYAMGGWRQGIVKEIPQDDLFEIQRFKVRLYRAGLIPENEEPEVTLLEEQQFGVQGPLD